ncbi:MAG: hypothetical protein WB988_10290 [Candidatus Nitrosopolaris sp.]|jgi:hypothetical protein
MSQRGCVAPSSAKPPPPSVSPPSNARPPPLASLPAPIASPPGDTFRTRGLQRETLLRSIPPLSLPSASQPLDVLPYQTNGTFQPVDTSNDQGTLSQETNAQISNLS